jgi:CheY-like chemotaxis protein
MKKKKIFFVDDELIPGLEEPDGHYMWYYTDALKEEGYEVIEAIGTDQAIAEMKSHSDIDLIILDIMMSPGKAFEKEDTMEGLRTGVNLARMLSKEYPKIPILVLTNLQPGTISDQLNYPTIKRIVHKPDCLPYDCVDMVSEILKGGS